VVVGLLLAGWGIFASERGESAPALREEVVEELVEGAGGGIAAELQSDVYAVAVATVGPDGEVTVGCTDPATAAQMIAEVTP
jgi:hypothetical protein